MLSVIDQSFPTAADNLAFDDELLDRQTPAVRFWESAATFVVLGRSGSLEHDVNLDLCCAAGVPVLRRSSGGGAVVQGPGCLNYSLILPVDATPNLSNIELSYAVLLERVSAALALPDLEVRGTDILLSGRKVSGNAQRRAGGWLLHHGTLLYAFDLTLIERFLPEPSRQPPHRQGRKHSEFVTTLPLPRAVIEQRLALAFSTIPSAGRLSVP